MTFYKGALKDLKMLPISLLSDRLPSIHKEFKEDE